MIKGNNKKLFYKTDIKQRNISRSVSESSESFFALNVTKLLTLLRRYYSKQDEICQYYGKNFFRYLQVHILQISL